MLISASKCLCELPMTLVTPAVSLASDIARSCSAFESTLPLNVTDMPERVIWVPMNSATSAVHQKLRVTAGAVVSIEVAR